LSFHLSSSYLRGSRYLLEKGAHGGDRKDNGSSGQTDHLKTDERLAALFKVSPKTVRRDAKFLQPLRSTPSEGCWAF
jgi:hypothetical protein